MANSDPSELPAPPWQRVPERRARRRRDPLTREAIVAAAMRILDVDGLAGLSMRRIAEELNTGAASLYWHIGSKDGLLDLLFDEIIGEQEVPDPDPERWRDQLKEVARTMRAAILRHRDVVRISIGRIPLGPHALRYSDRVLAILIAGGLPKDLAVAGHHLLISVVNGFTIDETGEMAEAPDEGAPPEEISAMVGDYLASLPEQRFPNLVALADELVQRDQDAQFELLIAIFVEGIAERARLATQPRPGRRRTR
jgi:AcrR family transcriptional regulator